jgi:hypothetical protein
LFYQLLLAINQGKIDWREFGLMAYGETHFPTMITSLNAEILRPFIRDAGYKLDEISEKLENSERIDAQDLRVFQNYGVVVHGNMQGSMAATNHSQIRQSSASYTDQSSLTKGIESLRGFLGEIPDAEQTQAEEAIETLMRSARGEDVPRTELAKKVEFVAARSSGMKERLIEIAVGAAGGVTSHGVILAIQFVLGLN